VEGLLIRVFAVDKPGCRRTGDAPPSCLHSAAALPEVMHFIALIIHVFAFCGETDHYRLLLYFVSEQQCSFCSSGLLSILSFFAAHNSIGSHHYSSTTFPLSSTSWYHGDDSQPNYSLRSLLRSVIFRCILHASIEELFNREKMVPKLPIIMVKDVYSFMPMPTVVVI
jgi:hypothetical protein